MSNSKNNLFRQQSVESLSGPNKINEYIRVTSPSLYLVLGAMIMCCIAVCFWLVYGTVNQQIKIKGIIFPHQDMTEVIVPYEGVILESYAHRGKFIQKGEPLFRIGCNGVQEVINAPASGVILSFKKKSEGFQSYQSVASIIPQQTENKDKELIAYASFNELHKLVVGQEVRVTPSNLQKEDYGYIHGTIISIDTYPVTKEEAAARFKLEQFANNVFPETTAYEVKITLKSDPQSPEKLEWSRKKSRGIGVVVGTFCNVQVITNRQPVYRLVFKNTENIIHQINE